MIVSLPSRTQLLSWVNHITNSRILKLQELSNAIHFCLIFDKMYPKIINFNKIKKDATSEIHKQHNFRILLNAINSLQIPVRINIIDLSSAKVTSILELLQWFYKQYKSPQAKVENNLSKTQRYTEPTIFKTFKGGLGIAPRQKSCFKDETISKKDQIYGKQRKSLDLKRISQHPIDHNRSKQSKSRKLEKSQMSQKLQIQNDMNMAQPTFSKSNSLIKDNVNNDIQINTEIIKTEKKSQDKKINSKVSEQNKIIFSKEGLERRSQQKKIQILQAKKNRKDQGLQQILKEAYHISRKVYQASLKKITDAAIQNNSPLREKIKQILISQLDKQDEYTEISQIDQKRKRYLESINTSLDCQTDTIQKILPENKGEITQYPVSQLKKQSFMEQKQQMIIKKQQVFKDEDNLMNYDAFNKHYNDQNKKNTLKKSAVKSQKSIAASINFALIPSTHSIQQVQNQNCNQNKNPINFLQPTNLDIHLGQKKPLVSSIFNPHLPTTNNHLRIIEPIQQTLKLTTTEHTNSQRQKQAKNKIQINNNDRRLNIPNLSTFEDAKQIKKNPFLNPQTSQTNDIKKFKVTHPVRVFPYSQKLTIKNDQSDQAQQSGIKGNVSSYTQDPNWFN